MSQREVSEPANVTLFGCQVSEDVIIKDFEMPSSLAIQVDPKHKDNPIETEKQKDTQERRL